MVGGHSKSVLRALAALLLLVAASSIVRAQPQRGPVTYPWAGPHATFLCPEKAYFGYNRPIGQSGFTNGSCSYEPTGLALPFCKSFCWPDVLGPLYPGARGGCSSGRCCQPQSQVPVYQDRYLPGQYDSPAMPGGVTTPSPQGAPRPGPGDQSSTSPQDQTPSQSQQDQLPSQSQSQAQSQQQDFGGDQFASLGSGSMSVNDASGGYLDNPVVGTWFRLRFDDASNDVSPDRAEFFYAKCGCFPGAPGPTNQFGESAKRVDYRELSPYMEVQLAPRFSIFAELPIRFLDIDFPSNTLHPNGLSDMNAGFKYAMYVSNTEYLTFQFKTYAPTGNASQGLGTNHTSVEPGLLYLGKRSQRFFIQAELRDWAPIGGTDFAGNVLRYGVGLNYDIIQRGGSVAAQQFYTAPQGTRVTSVTEFVGWSVLGGKQLGPDGAESAANVTIVNFKQGVRLTHGQDSLYVGWGHALTTQTWYSDLFRLEYRRMF